MRREEAVETRLGRVLQCGDVPALSEHVREVASRLANPEVTPRDLSLILRKDVGLALRVLRAANSANYNRSGRAIASLGHGAALVGLEGLREMIVPLLNRGEERERSAVIRPVAGLALLTATQARVAAAHLRLRREEEAYLCGLFRGLGELLVGWCFPADYARILALGKDGQVAETVASQRVMQCSFEELGQAAARAWNLPPAVVATMHSEPLIGPSLVSEGDRLEAAVSFAHEITAAVHRTAGAVQQERLRRIGRIFSKAMGLRRDDLERLVEQAREEARGRLTELGLDGESLLLSRQREQMETLAARWEEEARAAEEEPAAATEQRVEAPLLEELAARMEAPGWRLERGMAEALEAARRLGAFDRAAWLRVSGDYTEMVAQLTAGAKADDGLGQWRVPLVRSNGAAAAALLARRDLLVERGGAPGRGWRGETPVLWGVFPIVVNRVLAGAVYVDRLGEGENPSAEAVEGVSRARDLMARMMERQRGERGGVAVGRRG
jgi:HD-like signal output (HDOD) protein